jgi:TatA/E family protein of Tat protein translocase
MLGLGAQEILIIGVGGLVLFGLRRLPEVARSLGRGPQELRRSTRGIMESLEEAQSTSEEGKREALASLLGKSGDDARGERTS